MHRNSTLGPDGVPQAQREAVADGRTVTPIYTQPFSLADWFGAATHIHWMRPTYADGFTLVPDTDNLTFAAVSLAAQLSARLISAAALPACTAAGAGVGKTLTMNATGTLTVDSVLTALNDIIVLKDQVTTGNNGVYKVTTAGAVGVAGVLTRLAGYDATIVLGLVVTATAGTVNTGLFYQLQYTLLTAALAIEFSVAHNPRLDPNDATAKFVPALTVTTLPAADVNWTIVNQTSVLSKWLRVKITPASGISKVIVRSFAKGY